MGTPLVAIDIETDTAAGGLDPRVAEMLSVALWADSARLVITGDDETTRLRRLVAELDALPQSVVVGWNSSVFDLPFLATRAEACGVDLGFVLVPDESIVPKYEFTPPHTCGYRARVRRHHHADVAYAYEAYAKTHGVTWSLKPVCESLGIDMVKVDASQVHLLSPEELVAYNLSDVAGTHALAARLGDDLSTYVDEVTASRVA